MNPDDLHPLSEIGRPATVVALLGAGIVTWSGGDRQWSLVDARGGGGGGSPDLRRVIGTAKHSMTSRAGGEGGGGPNRPLSEAGQE